MKKIPFILFTLIPLLAGINLSCRETTDNPLPIPMEDPTELRSEIDSLSYHTGIPLYHADQGKEFWTDFNSQIRPYSTGDARTNLLRPYFQANPYLSCMTEGGEGTYGVRMAFFKTLFDDELLPERISKEVLGLSFNAFGYQSDTLHVDVLGASGEVIAKEYVELETLTFKTYTLTFDFSHAKEVRFYASAGIGTDSIGFGLDDVYLTTVDSRSFSPPKGDEDFLAWLKRSSFNFFDWNYVNLAGEQGVLLESYTHTDKVSLSGIAYAYAVYVLAAEDGFISSTDAKERIKGMLRWQGAQNWFDGTGGWHGFPHHYFRKDGSYHWPDVSTIDWAMCAAGLRVVRQYYSGDAEMVALVDTLLSRPDWTAALGAEGKIAMGFDGTTGEMNDYRWGLAFSEETELVYLEAVASGELGDTLFADIIREEKGGFYPSWFGAGFTYNWLQLWTGPLEPYKTNSTAAFDMDASTSLRAFDRPLMGLTACTTVKEERSEGFLVWSRYISNQGGAVHGAGLGQVIQISPAPYGAALALPFSYEKAMSALREFVNLGFYHEYLGLPDNVRMKGLPSAILPAPNWDPFDINIAPVILSIEQVKANRIGALYRADSSIQRALPLLIDSF